MEPEHTTSNNEAKQFPKEVLLTYFVITFLITWTCWITTILILRKNDWSIPSVLTFLERSSSDRTSLQIWLNLVFSLGTFGPFISAGYLSKKFGKEALIKIEE